MEKYFRVGQTTDNTTQWTAGYIPKVTDTNSEFVNTYSFTITAMVISAPQCYIIHAFPVLLTVGSITTCMVAFPAVHAPMNHVFHM